MLRAIALENFKAYERLERLELRPLTVFCGPNAVGKSSVIQSLLMMQQTIDQQTEGHAIPLVTDGEAVALGDYVDVLLGHDLRRRLGVVLAVPLTWGEGGFWTAPTTLTLEFLYQTDVSNLYETKPEMWEWLYRVGGAVPSLGMLLTVREDDGRELVTVGMGRQRDDYYNEFFGVRLTFGARMRCADRDFEGSVAGMQRVEDWFEETKRDGVTLSEWDDDCGEEELVGLVSRMLQEASQRLSVCYVGPAREAPERYYDVDHRSMGAGSRRRAQGDLRADIGQFGEPSRVRRPSGNPRSLYAWQRERLHLRTGSYPIHFIPASIPLDEAVNSWLSYLGLPEVRLVFEGKNFRFAVPSPYVNGCSVSVTDTGYGVSQVLPTLLAGLVGREEIVVLDQPELHLHPKVQTGIADFALAVAERRQVLVETHSDHFVNRIVRRVVEGQVNRDEVAVYFFTPTSEGPHVEMVEVDPTYGIKNWPLGFFDDYANEQEAIIRASLERRAGGDST